MFNKQKKYFQSKLDGVQKMVWDIEFKRFKTREIREEIRQEYDNLKSKLSVIQTKIASQKKDPTKICEIHNPGEGKEKVHKDKGKCECEYIDNHIEIAEIEGQYDQEILLSRDIERFIGQMKGLDLEIEGCKPNAEYHDGVQGINDQLAALRELQGMLKDYINGL